MTISTYSLIVWNLSFFVVVAVVLLMLATFYVHVHFVQRPCGTMR